MQITCLGAARTVTGSCYKVQMDDGTEFLVDCGMHQGGRDLEERNWDNEAYDIDRIKAIFITHAHIDHSGLAPRLVKQGYRGPIYATEPTCDLLKILWQDSAHIQEMEAKWQTRRNKRQLKRLVEPLYNTIDAQETINLLKPIELACHVDILPGVDVCYYNAGHILGAASLYITGGTRRNRPRSFFPATWADRASSSSRTRSRRPNRTPCSWKRPTATGPTNPWRKARKS